MSRLGDLEARCAEATEGPWTTGGHESDLSVDAPGLHGRLIYDEGGHTLADAVFIAAARTDLPDLAQSFRVVSEALRRIQYVMDQEGFAWGEDQEQWDTALVLIAEWLGGPDD